MHPIGVLAQTFHEFVLDCLTGGCTVVIANGRFHIHIQKGVVVVLGIGEWGDKGGVGAGVGDGIDGFVALIDGNVHGVTAAIAHFSRTVVADDQVNTVVSVTGSEEIGFEI